METKTSNFLKHISYLQVIGIVLVVAGHSMHEYPDSNYGADLLVHRLIYSFHMPLFMFASGYLMMYTSFIAGRDRGAVRFIAGKLRRLILPFILLSVLAFVPRSVMSSMAEDNIPLSATYMLKSLYRYDYLVIPYFWFLQSVFTLLVGCYLYMKTARRIKMSDGMSVAVLTAFFIALPMLELDINYQFFSIGQTIKFGIFFAIGMIFARYEPFFYRAVGRDSALAIFIFAGIWLAEFFLSGEKAGRWLYIVGASAAIFMWLWISRRMVRKKMTWLDRLAGSNYIIFLLSWFFNVLSQQVLHHYVEMPWYVFTILSIAAGIGIPVAFYHLLQRYRHIRTVRIISYLLGQK